MINTVLLDRDGVINFDSPHYILSPQDWKPIEGSLQAIASLTKAGIQIGICSNQSALGRGMFRLQDMQAIHQKMLKAIQATGGKIAHTAYCPHVPKDACACRKPLAGLLLKTLKNLHANAKEAVMIGDSLRDVQAALAANVEPILVQSGYGDAQLIEDKARALHAKISVYPNLSAAVSDLKLTRPAT